MPEDRSTPALMGDLIESVTQLVRKEIQLFRAEMGEKATQAMVAAGSILAAGVIALTALNVLAAALVAALAKAGHSGGLVGGDRRRGPGDHRVRPGEKGHQRPQGEQSGARADRARRGPGRHHGKGEDLMAEFHTDPGDRSVSELEREVDQRARACLGHDR